MKKTRITIIALVAAVAFSTGAVAKNVFDIIRAEVRTDFVVEFDGEHKKLKNVQGERVYPILHEGTTYLPVRAISELIGKEVHWYEGEKRIVIKDKTQSSTVTDADVIVSGNEKNTDHRSDGKTEEKYNEANFIGKDKAKETALKDAGINPDSVGYVEVELDKERSVIVYDVEFKTGGKEYGYEINAETGEIIHREVEIDD